MNRFSRIFPLFVAAAAFLLPPALAQQGPPSGAPGNPSGPGNPPTSPPPGQPPSTPAPAPPGQPGRRPNAGAAAAAPATASPATPSAPAPKKVETSVVRVNVTNQAYDLIRPWAKKAPFSRRGLGAVLAKGRVLVTAELIQNQNYVELEKAISGDRSPARILVVDYEANLALLEPTDKKFLDGLKPIELSTETVVGDRVGVLQLEQNDALVTTPGPVTTIEVARYQLDDTAFLLYRLSVSLPFKESSFTAPVLRDKDARLAGMLLRYTPQTQTADVIPGPVIAHFLKDFDSGKYRGFPRAGFVFSTTRDPQLRRWAGLKGGGGILVTEVLPGSPADKAGLKPGDALLSVGDANVDQDGNYEDPLYGRIALSHYLNARHYADEKLPFKILREGKPLTLDVTLGRKPPEEYPVMPYFFDRAPRFQIVGGLILQELTRQHLKEWGADWRKAAPQRLVLYDQLQSQLIKEGRQRVVFLSQVLPTETTVGYNEMAMLVVTAINGVKLSSLDDVDRALAQPVNGFHKIELEDHPREIYLDAATLARSDDEVRRTYRLPALKRLE